MLGSLVDLGPRRESIPNVGNLTERFCHGNCLLQKNRPKWLNLKSFNLLDGRQGEKGVAHWCMPYHTLISSLHFLSSMFFSAFHFLSHSHIPSIFPCFSLFSLLLFSHLFRFTACLPPLLCTAKPFFYIACCDKFYCFTPQLLLTRYGCPS